MGPVETDNRMVLTKEGYEELRRELEDLQTVKRHELAVRLKDAIALGDLSENFDYHDAKRQQGMMEARIRDLKMILGSATIIEKSNGNGCVAVGSKVMVKDEDGFEEEYMIVGPLEADPSDGKISYECSMGEALMDHKAGDKISVETPAGVFAYEIITVS
jgi:transcription elongation factor GreA